jgi:hypothetical protein
VKYHPACYMLHAVVLLGLVSYREEGGDVFLLHVVDFQWAARHSITRDIILSK